MSLEVCPLHNVLSILSTSQCCPTPSRHWVVIVLACTSFYYKSCLHRWHCPRPKVDQHRFGILSTSCTFFFVHIVDILSTSCHFILFHRRHCRSSNVEQHQIDIVSTLCAVVIVYIVYSRYCLHRLKRLHWFVDRHRVDIVSTS